MRKKDLYFIARIKKNTTKKICWNFYKSLYSVFFNRKWNI